MRVTSACRGVASKSFRSMKPPSLARCKCAAVVALRTRGARGAVTDGARKRGACSLWASHRRDDTASAANAFSRSETHRGLPTGTIALRRRRARVGLTTLSVFVGERAGRVGVRSARLPRARIDVLLVLVFPA